MPVAQCDAVNGAVYLSKDGYGGTSVTPQTTFSATNQGVAETYVRSPVCTWFEYDWLEGRAHPNTPDCAGLGAEVFGGDAVVSTIASAQTTCVNAANFATASPVLTGFLQYTCSPQ